MNSLGLHLVVLLFERVDLAADQLDLVDVARDCAMGMVSRRASWGVGWRRPREGATGRDALTLAFVVDVALRLGLELGADAVEQVVEALAGPARGSAHDARRVAVVHGHGMDALGQDGGLLGARAVGEGMRRGLGSRSGRRSGAGRGWSERSGEEVKRRSKERAQCLAVRRARGRGRRRAARGAV